MDRETGCIRAEQLWKFRTIRAFVMLGYEIMMPSLVVKMFRKTARCPSSQTLLAYRRQQLIPKERVAVESHLSGCDFCSAEIQLLTFHRGNTEEYRLTEMPVQLRRLAEDLLTRSSEPFNGLALLSENHQLSH